MRLVQYFALGTVLSAYATIVLGGYVSATGAGLACPDWPTCHGQLVPPLTDPLVASEYFHRLAAAFAGVFALGTLILVWGLFRTNVKLLVTANAAFGLLVIQVLLGMITVSSLLEPVVVTAHLGVAAAFISLMTVATILTFRLGPKAEPERAKPFPQEAS